MSAYFEAGKGSIQRPEDHKKFSDNYDLIFGKKKNIKQNAPIGDTSRIEELISIFKEYPEPICDKCGRVIYCGKNNLCEDTDCGLNKK